MNAIFLGSFNPPHIGHLNAIQSVLEDDYYKIIDRIHIIPCKQNPNKSTYKTSYIARYKMCEMLFKDLIDAGVVVIDDIENEILPEYTYDLLKWINNNDYIIGKDFKWIITEETLEEIINNKWHNSKEILNEFGARMIVLSDNKSRYEDLNYIDLRPGINVHSTDIRNLAKECNSIELYTNKDISDFIKNNKIYR